MTDSRRSTTPSREKVYQKLERILKSHRSSRNLQSMGREDRDQSEIYLLIHTK